MKWNFVILQERDIAILWPPRPPVKEAPPPDDKEESPEGD